MSDKQVEPLSVEAERRRADSNANKLTDLRAQLAIAVKRAEMQHLHSLDAEARAEANWGDVLAWRNRVEDAERVRDKLVEGNQRIVQRNLDLEARGMALREALEGVRQRLSTYPTNLPVVSDISAFCTAVLSLPASDYGDAVRAVVAAARAIPHSHVEPFEGEAPFTCNLCMALDRYDKLMGGKTE